MDDKLDRLEKLAHLKEQGLLSDAEFSALKQRIVHEEGRTPAHQAARASIGAVGAPSSAAGSSPPDSFHLYEAVLALLIAATVFPLQGSWFAYFVASTGFLNLFSGWRLRRLLRLAGGSTLLLGIYGVLLFINYIQAQGF
jgi:hypothetical protein